MIVLKSYVQILVAIGLCIFGVDLKAQSLIAHYPMNGDAIDVSGNRNDGELFGGVTKTTDRWGNPCGALLFNGIDGYIEVPDSRSLQSPLTEFSVTSWFFLKNNNSDSYNWITLICKGDDQDETWINPQYRIQVLQAHNQSTVSISTNFTEYDNDYVNHLIPTDTWVFFSLTFDGFSIRFFLNGQEVWNSPYSESFQRNSSPLHIGKDIPGVTEFFNGKLDELRIYSSALSKQQISNLYNDDSGSSYGREIALKCPESYYGFTAPSQCGSTVRYTDPVADVSCSNTEIKLLKGLESGEEFPVGVTDQVFLAENEANQRKVCEFKITVVDNEPPELICPKDTTLFTVNPSDKSVRFVHPFPLAIDNCKVKEKVQVSGSVGPSFPIGNHILKFRATDESGNFTECSYSLIVLPLTVPTNNDSDLSSLPKKDDSPTQEEEITIEAQVREGGIQSIELPDGNNSIGEIDLQHELTFDDCEITAVIFDGSKQDYDTVSVYFNDVLIMDRELVKVKRNGAAIKQLNLTPGEENLLVSYAWNTGQLGPNTLKIEFYRSSDYDSKDRVKPILVRKIHSTPGLSGAIKLYCEK